MESNIQYSSEVEYIPIRVMDKMYYVTDFKVTQQGEPIAKEEQVKYGKKNAFLMILDILFYKIKYHNYIFKLKQAKWLCL